MAVAKIPYQDLGKRYQIQGEFGKLYTDFNIRGTVLAPTGKGDKEGMVRIEMSHINGEEWSEGMIKYVITDKKFEVGSKVALVIREEAKLIDPNAIDQILVNPVNHRMHCTTSLHLMKVLDGEDQSGHLPKEVHQQGEVEEVAELPKVICVPFEDRAQCVFELVSDPATFAPLHEKTNTSGIPSCKQYWNGDEWD